MSKACFFYLEANCYGFRDVSYLPAVKLDPSSLRIAIEANRIFMKKKPLNYKQIMKLKDPLHEKYFKKTRTKIDFPDYFKVFHNPSKMSVSRLYFTL